MNSSNYKIEFFHQFFNEKISRNKNFNLLAFYDKFYEYLVKPFLQYEYIYDRKEFMKQVKHIKPVMKYFHCDIVHDEFRKKYDVKFYFKKYNKIHFEINLQFYYDETVIVELKYDSSFRKHVKMQRIPDRLNRFHYSLKYVEVIYSDIDSYSSNIYFSTNDEYRVIQENRDLSDGTAIAYFPYYNDKLVLFHESYIYFGKNIQFNIKREGDIYLKNPSGVGAWKQDISDALVRFLNEEKANIDNMNLNDLKVVEIIDY